MLYCYALIDRSSPSDATTTNRKDSNTQSENESQNINTAASSTSTSQHSVVTPYSSNTTDCLEAFFPFDPCHLVMSQKCIENVYSVWSDDGDDEGKEDSEVDAISSSLEILMSL